MRGSLRTVRLRYIYICGASALLSAMLLFVVYRMSRFAYHHILSEATGVNRIVHWGINHVGTRPFLIFIGVALFALFFWIRSQKISDDMNRITLGTQKMAAGQIPAPIEVLNRGELRQIAANLNDVALRMHKGQLSGHEGFASMTEYTPGLDNHADEKMKRDEVQRDSAQADLPIKLTLYGVRSALEEIMNGHCREEAEIERWVKLAYEQTLLLQHALESVHLDAREQAFPEEQEGREQGY
ncbi:HAMP domain-containing protein [Paenibacillus sp. ACRRY]|uniref:HAMP domain-containing protein n=1 Tax=Paenibacillus sp. ACRRY TaxID=2918208 RepID=UPI001EF46D23|nr:HAMP domain-containing protein [Paenibacillus sp. ACRRY]MCG7385519.1 HAMP domain-containing protein [Paenibacillus sp. ACRRY]